MTLDVSRLRPASLRRARSAVAAALTGAVALITLTGCSGVSLRDNICSDGEYPVMTIGATGRACVKDGAKMPEGYTRFPEGKVPQKVDDKWDVYWRTHTLDKQGTIVDAPE